MGLLTTGDPVGRAPTGPPPSPILAGIACRCPRCGRGPMFEGLLKVRASCNTCGLAIGEHDSGDGAAAFVILILGALIMPLAFWMESALAPPVWVHGIVWSVVVIGGTVALLRPLKAILTALHYRHPTTHD